MGRVRSPESSDTRGVNGAVSVRKPNDLYKLSTIISEIIAFGDQDGR